MSPIPARAAASGTTSARKVAPRALALSLEAWKERGELVEAGLGPLSYLYVILER